MFIESCPCFARVQTLSKIQGVFLEPYKSLYFDIKFKSLDSNLCACIKQPSGKLETPALDVQKNGAQLHFEVSGLCVTPVTKRPKLQVTG